MKELIKKYHAVHQELRDIREKEFPFGIKVFVDCPQYKGPGTVDLKVSVPLDMLPVKLENGNTWYYPLEACRRAE
jgi:hypothetical protein